MPKKTVLITGSSKGIGKATAELFSKKGWNVAATMRDPGKYAVPGCLCLELDVTKPDTIKKALKETLERFGSIDVAVNNAGYGAVGPFETSSREQIMRQFETNLFGLMEVTKNVLPHFRDKRDGMIINVTSVAGRMSFPLYSLYNSTKWAVEGFSEALRFELEPFNIKIKIIEPALIKTEFGGSSADVISAGGIKEYEDFVRSVAPWTNGKIKLGHSPEKVAGTIYRAATDGSNKFRYPSGEDGRFLLFIRRFIPDSWLFAGIKKAVIK
ncbi:MAG: SDR family oxidoreductase [Candidatus Margulisiibacteriota bacterium]